jgi:hypothetical protein
MVQVSDFMQAIGYMMSQCLIQHVGRSHKKRVRGANILNIEKFIVQYMSTAFCYCYNSAL